MKHRPVFFLLAVLCFLFLLLGNSQLAVTDPVESNYALTAKEMVLSGDWISPQIYGTYWFDKPIFIYWMLCISYTLCGFTDFASRLPGALFGTASVVLAAWYMLRRTGRMTAALVVAAMTVTSLAVWAISHSIITDQMLFFFTSAAMFFAYIGLTEGKKWYVVAAYVMAGFAVLTKGPVGIVLPGTFLLVFIALRRNTQYIKRLFPPVGIVLFLLVVLSWYGTMYARHGAAFIDGFLGFNNVVRATVSEHPEMNVWYYYVVLVPVSLLPWTGPCLYGLWKRRGWTDEYVFMTVWAVGTILFYTAMATKYPTYAYIANMPLLYIGALAVMDLHEKSSRKIWTVVTGPALFFWLLFLGAALFAKPGAVVLGDLFWLIVFIPLATAILVFSQWQKALPAIPIVITAGTMVIYGLLTFQVLTPFYEYRSSSALIEASSKFPGQIYFFEEYRTSFVYYTDKRAVWTAPASFDENARLKRDAVWSKKHLFPTEEERSVMDKLQRREALTLIVPRSRYDDYVASSFFPLTRQLGKFGTYTVFTTL